MHCDCKYGDKDGVNQHELLISYWDKPTPFQLTESLGGSFVFPQPTSANAVLCMLLLTGPGGVLPPLRFGAHKAKDELSRQIRLAGTILTSWTGIKLWLGFDLS